MQLSTGSARYLPACADTPTSKIISSGTTCSYLGNWLKLCWPHWMDLHWLLWEFRYLVFRHLHLTASLWVAKSYNELQGDCIRKKLSVTQTTARTAHKFKGDLNETLSFPPKQRAAPEFCLFLDPQRTSLILLWVFSLQIIQRRVLVRVWTSLHSNWFNQFSVQHDMSFKMSMQVCQRHTSGTKWTKYKSQVLQK